MLSSSEADMKMIVYLLVGTLLGATQSSYSTIQDGSTIYYTCRLIQRLIRLNVVYGVIVGEFGFDNCQTAQLVAQFECGENGIFAGQSNQ